MSDRLPARDVARLHAELVRIQTALWNAPVGEEPKPPAVAAAARLEQDEAVAELPADVRDALDDLVRRVRDGGNSIVRVEVRQAAEEVARRVRELADEVEFRVPRVLADGDVWELTRPMWFSLRTPYEPDPRLTEATPGQRALYAVQWAIAEVSNAGFEQYLDLVGALAAEAVRGGRAIGADELAEIVEEATRRDGDRDDLDRRFYELLERVDHDELMRRYVEAHPDEFFLPD